MSDMNQTKLKRIRISLRAVGSTCENQPPLYSASLADGLSITCNSSGFTPMNAALRHLGIENQEFDFSKICAHAEKLRQVISVGLGDRKLFFVPKTSDENETRKFTLSLLEHANIERICSLSFTHFSFHKGSLPLAQCRWLLETIAQFDATNGPYRIWFEVPEIHFSELKKIQIDISR